MQYQLKMRIDVPDAQDPPMSTAAVMTHVAQAAEVSVADITRFEWAPICEHDNPATGCFKCLDDEANG